MTELLTPADAAKILGVTPSMVRWLEKHGHVSALRTAGGTRLFLADHIKALAARRAEKKKGVQNG